MLSWRSLSTVWLGLVCYWFYAGTVFAAIEHEAIQPFQNYTASLEFYDIEARSLKELKEQLKLKGPRDELGKERHARTIWTISWSWKGEWGVDFQRASSSYSARVILPRWINRDSAKAKLQARWDRYFQALAEHELQHVKHAAENYRAIAAAIRSAAQENPELSEAQANEVARAEISRIRLLDTRYDRESRHGYHEGVHLD